MDQPLHIIFQLSITVLAGFIIVVLQVNQTRIQFKDVWILQHIDM